MTRPNIHAENLLAAAIRFGDAQVAYDRLVSAWQRADPSVRLREASSIALEAENDLKRAARAYATRMRRKTKL